MKKNALYVAIVVVVAAIAFFVGRRVPGLPEQQPGSNRSEISYADQLNLFNLKKQCAEAGLRYWNTHKDAPAPGQFEIYQAHYNSQHKACLVEIFLTQTNENSTVHRFDEIDEVLEPTIYGIFSITQKYVGDKSAVPSTCDKFIDGDTSHETSCGSQVEWLAYEKSLMND